MSNLNIKELEAVNLVQTRKRKAPYTPLAKKNGFQNENTDRPKSHDCNFFRHFQKECNKCQAAGAPIIDAQGQLHQSGVSTGENMPHAAYGQVQFIRHHSNWNVI
jgi:hypothetical protein